MADVGKMLVIGGVALVAIGLAVWLLGRAGFKGLPGDVRYGTENVRVYFPIVTCIALSVGLTAAIWLWQWLTRK